MASRRTPARCNGCDCQLRGWDSHYKPGRALSRHLLGKPECCRCYLDLPGGVFTLPRLYDQVPIPAILDSLDVVRLTQAAWEVQCISILGKCEPLWRMMHRKQGQAMIQEVREMVRGHETDS